MCIVVKLAKTASKLPSRPIHRRTAGRVCRHQTDGNGSDGCSRCSTPIGGVRLASGGTIRDVVAPVAQCEVEAHAAGDRRQSKQQRANSQARTRSFNGRNRYWLRRTTWRHGCRFDLRKDAARSGLRGTRSGSGRNSANSDCRRTPAQSAENNPRFRLWNMSYGSGCRARADDHRRCDACPHKAPEPQTSHVLPLPAHFSQQCASAIRRSKCCP